MLIINSLLRMVLVSGILWGCQGTWACCGFANPGFPA